MNIDKAFMEKVDKRMNTTFGLITQSHMIGTLAKKKTRVLALLMFYETRKILRKLSKC